MATRDKEKYDKACNYCIENRDEPQKEKINYIINEYNYSDSTARACITLLTKINGSRDIN